MAKEVVQKMCVQNNQPNYSMNNQDEKNKYISNLYELIDLGGQPKRTMKIIRLYMHSPCHRLKDRIHTGAVGVLH